MCSNISATTACGEYISVSCHVFIDRGLLPTTKLQNQGSLDMKMKSSLRRFYYCYHDLVNCHGEYMSRMTTDILVVEMKSYSFFSFVVYCQIFGMINMKCAEGLVRNEVRVARSLVFCVVFCRLLYFFSSFFQLSLHILVVLIPLTSSG
jgi:ABC-type multidrug transport system fused ATPase/permease subunit